MKARWGFGIFFAGTLLAASLKVFAQQQPDQNPPGSAPTLTGGGYSYLHIAAGQATTVVKPSSGILHAIIFGGAATATNVTTLYDNTAASGTIIGIPVATAVTFPVSEIYDLSFNTGLTISTTTANGADMTVVYK